MKAYKFRLYPNKEQEQKLEFALDICRQTYNFLLEELNNQAETDKKKIQHKIVELKQLKPELNNIYSKTLQYECYRLFSNLRALSQLKKNGKKVGRLRFKGRNWFKTMNYNQSGFKLIKTNKRYDLLYLSKIGNIKILQHREVEGKIKQVTIKKLIDRWYATIITNTIIKTKCGDKIIGIDLGVNNFIIDSENNIVENPLNFTKYTSKLREAHKDLSRKKKGSKNRLKAKLKLARLYEHVNNSRDDFLHKISTKYTKECKIVVIENLSIKQMMEQKYYNAKNIADSSWGRFIHFLAYKAESAGCKIIKVDPRNTTRICSICGKIQEMPLYKRLYKCSCGLKIDRDYNSAINILNKGLGQAYVEIVSDSSEQLSKKQEAISSTQKVLGYA